MQTLNAQKGFVTERRMSALGCHVGASPLYKIPAKMITQTTSLRKGEKGNSNCAKLYFPVLTSATEIEPMQHIYALGFLERVRLFLVLLQSQQQHPTK